jgi:2-polyprenyl-6-methoxyphenol hydroxylase-like FAD-dependent oxidoreductase
MSTTYDFTGKVAFVTGAASGIGRATALAFARAGAQVAIADRSTDALEETARLITADGGKVLALTCDVTSEEDVQRAVERTVEQFGRLTPPSTTRASSSPSSRPPTPPGPSGTAFSASASPERSCAPGRRSGRC